MRSFQTGLLARTYKVSIEAGFALIPALAITYLFFFSGGHGRVENALFHELAVTLAIITSGFLSFVTWRCYHASGEVFLRWLTLGFIGFTLVYLPHGVLTRTADENLWFFMLYGPASRLVMTGCLLVGLLRYGCPPDASSKRNRPMFWLNGLLLFMAIDGLVAVAAHSDFAGSFWLRLILEGGALLLASGGIGILLVKRPSSPLMRIYLIALALFTQSSLSFLLLATPWDHQWWLAHGIFAAGFLLMGYGVIQAYLTTGSFATVFSMEQVLKDLRFEKQRAEDALRQLERTNQELNHLATTDGLTGLANRRHFMDNAQRRLKRCRLDAAPRSLLAIDIDHFKRINDTYGHQIGDAALIGFTQVLTQQLRPDDFLGRVGGEEFLALIEGDLSQATMIAERLRQTLEQHRFEIGDLPLQITVSIGIAELVTDGDTLESLIQAADTRLYRAKHQGRNRVIAREEEPKQAS